MFYRPFCYLFPFCEPTLANRIRKRHGNDNDKQMKESTLSYYKAHDVQICEEFLKIS